MLSARSGPTPGQREKERARERERERERLIQEVRRETFDRVGACDMISKLLNVHACVCMFAASLSCPGLSDGPRDSATQLSLAHFLSTLLAKHR